MVSKAYGPNHPDVTFFRRGLAWVYCDQGRFKVAEERLQQILQLRETSLGKQHASVADACADLGDFFYNQERPAEAEPQFNRALDIRRDLYGEFSPQVADSLRDLAFLRRLQARAPEAEELFRQALAILQSAYGADDLQVAYCRRDLAWQLNLRGRDDEAERLLDAACATAERLLPGDRPDRTWYLRDMARFQYGQGQSDKARELLDEILRIRSAKLRPSHIDLARIHGDLANFHENEGHYDEAEKCYLAALEITQQALGAHHPATDDRRYDLGWYLLRRKKRIEDAEQEFRRAIQVIEGSCPADDPRLVDPLMALAWVFNRSRKPHQLSEGASSMQRALAIARKHWGQDHARVARVCENFADYLYNRKRYADAEPLYRGALENRLARFGPLHPEVADSQRDLAWNQEELAEFAEAEHLLRDALRGLEHCPEPESEPVQDGRDNLASFLVRRGQLSAAGVTIDPVLAMASNSTLVKLAPLALPATLVTAVVVAVCTEVFSKRRTVRRTNRAVYTRALAHALPYWPALVAALATFIGAWLGLQRVSDALTIGVFCLAALYAVKSAMKVVSLQRNSPIMTSALAVGFECLMVFFATVALGALDHAVVSLDLQLESVERELRVPWVAENTATTLAVAAFIMPFVAVCLAVLGRIDSKWRVWRRRLALKALASSRQS